MKNRVFTITDSQLNSGEEIFIDDIPIGYGLETFNTDLNRINYFYPKQVIINNYTKATIGINIFYNEKEYIEYQSDNSNFDYIIVYSGSTLENKNLTKTQSIVVKRLDGFAESNLTIQFINYVDI